MGDKWFRGSGKCLFIYLRKNGGDLKTTLNSRILEVVKSYGGTIIDLEEDIKCMHLIADLIETVEEHYKIEKEFDDEFDANIQPLDRLDEYLSKDKDVIWEL